MKKRTLALFLALSCPLTLAAHAAEGLDNFTRRDTYANQFADVTEKDWFASSVAGAFEFGLMKGSNGLFDPKGQVTVAQALAMACRIHDQFAGGDGVFEQGSPWYQVYVDYAREHELLKFEPADVNAPATRGEFASILSAALPDTALHSMNQVDSGAIPDVPMDHPYAADIYRLYRAGVLTGAAGGACLPDSTIQRSESAAITTRMVDPQERKTITLVKEVPADLQYARSILEHAYSLDYTNYGRILADVTHDGIPEVVVTCDGEAALRIEVYGIRDGDLACLYTDQVDHTDAGQGILSLAEIDGRHYLSRAVMGYDGTNPFYSYHIFSLDADGQPVDYYRLDPAEDPNSDEASQVKDEFWATKETYEACSTTLADSVAGNSYLLYDTELDWTPWTN